MVSSLIKLLVYAGLILGTLCNIALASEPLISGHHGIEIYTVDNAECSGTMKVTVKAPHNAIFEDITERYKLEGALGLARSVLSFECAGKAVIEELVLEGEVNEKSVYTGLSSASENWVLKDLKNETQAKTPEETQQFTSVVEQEEKSITPSVTMDVQKQVQPETIFEPVQESIVRKEEEEPETVKPRVLQQELPIFSEPVAEKPISSAQLPSDKDVLSTSPKTNQPTLMPAKPPSVSRDASIDWGGIGIIVLKFGAVAVALAILWFMKPLLRHIPLSKPPFSIENARTIISKLIPIADMKRRRGLFVILIKDKNFISAIFLFVILNIAIFLNNGENNIALIPYFFLSWLLVIITYDTGLSYVVHKFKVFNPKESLKGFFIDNVFSNVIGSLSINAEDNTTKITIESVKLKSEQISEKIKTVILRIFVPSKWARRQIKMPILWWILKPIKRIYSTFMSTMGRAIQAVIPWNTKFDGFFYKYFMFLFIVAIKLPLSFILLFIKKALLYIFSVKWMTDLLSVFIQILKDLLLSLWGAFVLSILALLSPFIIIFQAIVNFVRALVFIFKFPKRLLSFLKKIITQFISCSKYIWGKAISLISKLKEGNGGSAKIALILVLAGLIVSSGFLPDNNISGGYGQPYAESGEYMQASFSPLLYIGAVSLASVFSFFGAFLLTVFSVSLLALLSIIAVVISAFVLGPVLTFIFICYLFFLNLTGSPVDKIFYLLAIKAISFIAPLEYQSALEFSLLFILIATDTNGFLDVFRRILRGDYAFAYSEVQKVISEIKRTT